MTNKSIKIGDRVLIEQLNGQEYWTTIDKIEICQKGSKYGTDVQTATPRLCQNGIIEAGDRWHYFYQIKDVISF